jgi:hypothetical protein
VVCDELGIGGSGEYCGDNDAHINRINVLYYYIFGGRYVPRALLFDLEPGVIGAVALSRSSANSSADCGDNNAHLDRINVIYHESMGGKYLPRAVLFDLEPGVIGAVALSRRTASSSVRAISWIVRVSKN